MAIRPRRLGSNGFAGGCWSCQAGLRVGEAKISALIAANQSKRLRACRERSLPSNMQPRTPANNKSNSDESKTADYVGTPRYLCPMLPHLTRVCWADAMPCRLICLSAMDDDAFHGRLPNI